MTFDDASHREIQPPRIPDVPRIDFLDEKKPLPRYVASQGLEVQRLRDRVDLLEFELEATRTENVRLQNELNNHTEEVGWAKFSSDEHGVYVTNPQTNERVTVAVWHQASLERMRDFYAARAAMCRYPFLQDDSCNREKGHPGEHAHLNHAQLDSEKYAPPLFPSPLDERPPCNLMLDHMGDCRIVANPNLTEMQCGKLFHPDECDRYCGGHNNV